MGAIPGHLTEKLACGRGSLSSTSGSGVGERKVELRLEQIWIEGERSLERVDRSSRVASRRFKNSDVGDDSRVVGLQPSRFGERLFSACEIVAAAEARRQPEIHIC